MDFLSLDNFIKITGENVNNMSGIYYIDVRYITIIRKKSTNNYTLYVDKEWIYCISEEDIKNVVNMRKAIDRDNKINSILEDDRNRG